MRRMDRSKREALCMILLIIAYATADIIGRELKPTTFQSAIIATVGTAFVGLVLYFLYRH